MRYEKHDFKHRFLNASGTNRGDKMVVAEFGKLVGQYPKVIVKAVRDAGVPIMSNANNKQLVEVVKRNIKKNPRLALNISTMIMASSDYDSAFDGYGSFIGTKKDGTQRKGLNLGKLFGKDKNNPSASVGGKKEKGGFLSGIFGKKDESTGKRTGGWFSKKEGGSKIGNFLRGKKGTDVDGVVQEKSGFGDWLSSNQEGLGNMASSLIGGLFSGGGSENAQNNANNQNTGGDGGDGGDGGSKGKGGLPLPLIIGGVLVVGGIIFLVMRGKGKKKK
jgi:hypothetical protein